MIFNRNKISFGERERNFKLRVKMPLGELSVAQAAEILEDAHAGAVVARNEAENLTITSTNHVLARAFSGIGVLNQLHFGLAINPMVEQSRIDEIAVLQQNVANIMRGNTDIL